jgi:uncharacterized membrane protein YkgB
MASFRIRIVQLDQITTMWMARYSISLLRISLGIIFFWFGILKFFPGASPAQDLAGRTIEQLSFGLVLPHRSLPLLALWEVLIGLGLLSSRFTRATVFLLVMQMIGTVTPLFLFPAETWLRFPFALTLEGQYILKNIVLVSGALAVGATARGGGLVGDRDLVDQYRARFGS